MSDLVTGGLSPPAVIWLVFGLATTIILFLSTTTGKSELCIPETPLSPRTCTDMPRGALLVVRTVMVAVWTYCIEALNSGGWRVGAWVALCAPLVLDFIYLPSVALTQGSTAEDG